jgi:hypothetical protein
VFPTGYYLAIHSAALNLILLPFSTSQTFHMSGKPLRKAGKQLKNDSLKDPSARAFIVVETSHGELARNAIVENFENLPQNCIAVIVRSDVSTVVARENMPAETVEVLSIAGAR